MMPPAVLLLLFLTFSCSSTAAFTIDGVPKVHTGPNCSYQDVLNHLNLTKDNELYTMTRPVKHYERPTWVTMQVLLYAILDVIEKEQKFIPYVWMVTTWYNEYISWEPDEFCGISHVSIPAEALWKPDLTIEEMTEKDKAPPSPYLTISSDGLVDLQNDQVLVSTCRMHVYKFPFDIQQCNLSFKSIMFTARDIRLYLTSDSSELTEESRDVMRTQSEWLFINMTVITLKASDLYEKDVIVYTITMKRRSILYIINFLMPVLFFLCLDLASFMISDSGGEKLSFKVTVLLAVTVLQLILNEILPASSNRIPLIAIYCMGIFALMLLSLMETIFVMYLIEKDSASQGNKADRPHEDRNKQGKFSFINSHFVPKWTQCACINEVSTGEDPSELSPVAKETGLEGSSSKLVEDCQGLEKISDDLRGMERTLSLLLNNKKEEEKPGYWTRVAKRVNQAFFIFYVTVLVVFLSIVFWKWNH